LPYVLDCTKANKFWLRACSTVSGTFCVFGIDKIELDVGDSMVEPRRGVEGGELEFGGR
jgi:hypothetical protein